MNWYLEVLKKYAVFDGRARRQEFWMFVLFNVIISIVLQVIEGFLGLKMSNGAGILSSLYSLAVLVPNIAVGVRRLHDTGRSGLWYLIVLTCVGVIVLLVWFVEDSQPQANKYGPNPKGGMA
jgi:uncharacterized membrane protein YhaH (DUF805 family)